MSQQPLTLDLPDYDPDLLSKDKVKQKEAVKKYLASKIRNDWEFAWPPVIPPPKQNGDAEAAPKPTPAPATEADAPVQAPVEQTQETAEPKPEATQTATNDDDVAVESMDSSDDDDEEGGFSDSDAESVYSTVSEDPARFKPRLEWVSDLSDEEPVPLSLSPFRFDSPDAIGAEGDCDLAQAARLSSRTIPFLGFPYELDLSPPKSQVVIILNPSFHKKITPTIMSVSEEKREVNRETVLSADDPLQICRR